MSSDVEKDLSVRLQLNKALQKYLDRTDITEIAINRPGEVWLETKTGWECLRDASMSYKYLDELSNICAVYGGENKVFDSAHPILSVELPDGERAQFVMPPACTAETLSLTVRKISKNVIELSDYANSGFFSRVRASGSVDPVSVELHSLFGKIHSGSDNEKTEARTNFLRRCVEAGKNIVIAGGTGSGKTTFMKALMQYIPVSQRIITIEDVPE
ncbi:ATPase, T2SS/T4P/T4SS family, partial [uncultured Parasutterella sp.]